MTRLDRGFAVSRTLRAALALHAGLAGAACAGVPPATALPIGAPIERVSSVTSYTVPPGPQGWQWGPDNLAHCINPFGIEPYVGDDRGLGPQDYRAPGAAPSPCRVGPQTYLGEDSYAQETAGAQGPQGEPGRDGWDGWDGESGPQGSSGRAGPQGPQGAAGARGAQGDVGASGSEGETGAQGATGAAGSDGPAELRVHRDIEVSLGPMAPKVPRARRAPKV